MITHYIPQWLLSEFKGERLHELDVQTGKIEIRGLRNAGSDDDLWPAEVEKSLMGIHDNRAAQIYKKRIAGALSARNPRIELSAGERWEFAQWLALMRPRVPGTFEDIKGMIAEAKDNPHIGLEVLFENRPQVINLIRRQNPPLFEEFVADVGRQEAEEWLIAMLAARMSRGELKWLPDARETYSQHLRTTPIDEFARILCRYQWWWLHSRSGFTIGDNPLLRWHKRSGRWNFGIRRAGVEISMPLSTNLCLLMRKRNRRYHGQVLECGSLLTRELNRRQRLASISCVYAASAALLDRKAKYGFTGA